MTKKKGLHYRIKLYKLMPLKYYAISALAYASVSIVSLVSVIMYAIDKQMANVVVYAVAFGVSFIGSIIKCVALRRSYVKRFILEQKEYKERIIKSATRKMSKIHRASGFKWENYAGQHYLCSDEVDKKLFENCKDLRIMVSPKKQAMDSDQKEALYNIVCKKIADGKSIFNSDMVRLRTDIVLDLFKNEPVIKANGESDVNFASDETVKDKRGVRKNFYKCYSDSLIKLEKTDYFYNISTNDQIYNEIFKFDFSSSYCGKDKSLDKKDMLYDLSQSPSANIVGVTTFAITSDGYLLLNLQGEMNDVNNGCFVPSGSGSSDFKDLIKCKKYEPEELRVQVDNFKRGKIKFGKVTDKTLSEINDPEKFKQFEKQLIKELKTPVDDSTEDDKTELAYKNAAVAKSERNGFKKYESAMKKYTYDFNTFLKYGMVRELIEESHLYDYDKKDKTKYCEISTDTRRNLINNTFVCGYIRILDRGGKPDFFGFTLLDLTLKQVQKMFKYGRNKYLSEEIEGNYKVTDFNEVRELKYAPYKKLLEYNDGVDNEKDFIINECGLKDRKDVKISLQTHCLLKLLRKKEIYDFITKKRHL